ncbi:MAG: hypothetical protein SF052_01390 [Bacteroidia bacterium]|nr:hypothetical protein [Bacteroidia bacterium]
MGKRKVSRGFWGLIKAVLVVASFPVAVIGLVYLIFTLLPRSYTSEARIQVVPLDKKETLAGFDSRMHELTTAMNQPRMQSLLVFQLIIHDLEKKPFRPVDEIKALYPEEMILFAVEAIKEKREKLQLGLSSSSLDSMINDMLIRLDYTPEKINKRLSVRRIPNTDLISIQADSRDSDLATFMVNTYTQEYIRYYEIVGKERLEKSVDFLERLLEQKRAELEEKSEQLQYHRDFLRSQARHSEIAGILTRISTLELNKKEEEALIENLKTSVLKKKKEKNQQIVIRTSNFVSNVKEDDRDLMVELGSALARKQFLEQQIEYLRGKLTLKEETALAPYRQEMESARDAYLEVLGKLKATKDSAVSLSHSLQQVTWGKSRFPLHEAPLFFSVLAGVAALILWVAFLMNIRYL